MFIRRYGEPNIFPFQKKVSTVFAQGDLCSIDANGFLVPAVQADTKLVIKGIIQRDVLATDTDYAAATMVAVDVPRAGEAAFEADVLTGTAAQTDVGELIEIDTAKGVDVVATTNPICKVEKIISTTKVIVSFASDIS
jgi:hypothetical protein